MSNDRFNTEGALALERAYTIIYEILDRKKRPGQFAAELSRAETAIAVAYKEYEGRPIGEALRWDHEAETWAARG